MKDFSSSEGSMTPDLIRMAGITPDEFDRRYGASPLYRATRNGFVRNVVTALGNSGKPEVIPALEKALSDSSAVVRASAAWALGQISPERASRTLTALKRNETDPVVLDEINLLAATGSTD